MKAVSKVLAIGAHPDDIELGCGATLAKLISQGTEVRALVLSPGTKGANIEVFDRKAETIKALNHLGISEIYLGDFADTYMFQYLNQIISFIEQHVREFAPDRVYTMYDQDRHQDHRTTYEASIVACRRVPQLLGYETPSSWPQFVPTMHEDVTDHFERKIEALLMHVSQADREYTQPEDLTVSARFRGRQVGRKHCEGFIPYRYIT